MLFLRINYTLKLFNYILIKMYNEAILYYLCNTDI